MKLLDRYVAQAIAVNVSLALGGFVLIFSVIGLMEELGSVGQGSYGVGDAVRFVLLRLPSESFELFPSAALVGCVLALGSLAVHGELVAMQACGVSYLRLAASVLQTTALAGVAMMLFAEFIAAPMARSAHVQRVVAVSGGRALSSATGLWTRSDSSVINVRSPLSDGTLRDLFLYEFDVDNRLRRYIFARSGRPTAEGWQLEDVVETTIDEDTVALRHQSSAPWSGLPRPRDLRSLLLPAEDLSLSELRSTIASLRRQHLLTHRYDLALWKRLTTPAVALVMIVVAMPLVLSSVAQRRHGRASVIAALAGVGFHMFNQTFSTFALVYQLPPFFGATAPGLAALVIGVWRFQKLR